MIHVTVLNALECPIEHALHDFCITLANFQHNIIYYEDTSQQI